jgi:hypothetical protein
MRAAAVVAMVAMVGAVGASLAEAGASRVAVRFGPTRLHE